MRCCVFLMAIHQCNLTPSWVDEWVPAFPESIRPKANVIARLEFELSYNHVTAQHVNHYGLLTPLYSFVYNHLFTQSSMVSSIPIKYK